MTITSRWIASAGLAGDAPVRALAERMTVATAAVATLSAFAGFMVPFPTFALFSPRRAQNARTRAAAHAPHTLPRGAAGQGYRGGTALLRRRARLRGRAQR